MVVAMIFMGFVRGLSYKAPRRTTMVVMMVVIRFEELQGLLQRSYQGCNGVVMALQRLQQAL